MTHPKLSTVSPDLTAPQTLPVAALTPSLASSETERGELIQLSAHTRALLNQSDDEALAQVAQRYLSLAARLGDDAAQAEALSHLITAEQRLGHYLQALEHLRRETEVRARLGDALGQVECLSNLGMLYVALGDYAEALSTLFQCQQLAAQYPEVPAEYRAACSVNIGHTYLALRQYDQALAYLLPGLAAAEQANDPATQLAALSDLGLVYKALGQYPKATQTLERGLALAQAAYPQELTDLTDNLGQVYAEMNQPDTARELFERSLAQAQAEGDLQGRVNAQLSLGRLAFAEGYAAQADELLQEALAAALAHELRQSALEVYQAFYRGYEAAGELAAAFPYLRAYQRLSRQLFNENSERRAQTLTARFEAERARVEAETYRQIGELSHAARLQAEATVRQRTAELEAAQIEIVTRLGMAAEYRDDQTGQHTRRVGELSAHLAQTLGLDAASVDLIRWAARLHDIGKIGVPDQVLLKEGRYSPEEFARMQTHVAIGASVLGGSRSPLLNMAEEIARTHHERWDGQGYPAGLSGEGIPLPGRIVAVADVFDALTTVRLYKPAWSIEAALREMQSQAGLQFDPQIVACLSELIASQRHSLGDVLEPRVALGAERDAATDLQNADSTQIDAAHAELAELIAHVWSLRHSHPSEAEVLACEALSRAESSGDERLLGLAHRNLGWFRFLSSAFEEALGHLVRGHDIGVALGDLDLQADCANTMAGVYNSLADYDQATEQLSAVLAIARQRQDRQREAHCLHNLGVVSKDSRSLEAADRYLTQSLAVYREVGDLAGEIQAMGTYAGLLFERGEHQLAVNLALSTAEQAHQHNQLLVQARAQFTAGQAYLRLSQYELAESLQKQALSYALSTGDKQAQGWNLYELGQVYGQRGDAAGAASAYHDALKLAQELSIKELEMQVYRSLSDLSAAAGDAQTALDYYRKHHAVELAIFSQEASLRTRALMVQLEVERARAEAQIYKLRSIELASANEALNQVNAEKSELVRMLEEQSVLLRRQLSQDGLTGLYNRKHIEGLLQREFGQYRQHQRSANQPSAGPTQVCIAMVDIDHFKHINDTFSHPVGDQVLRNVAELFGQICRPTDAVGRYGGEEFLFVFPHTTLEQGRRICERLQAAIRAYDWHQVHPGLQVRLSIGVSADVNVPNHERLISRADALLYQAKHTGRDKICW